LREVYPISGPDPLAREFGLGRETICRRARELGLLTPLAVRKKEVKRTLREDYFTSWSPAMAYDLGYIWADGTIAQKSWEKTAWGLNLNCQTPDESLILGLRERLGSTHAIKRIWRTQASGRETPMSICGICSRKIAGSLIDHGVLPNKSNLDLSFPHGGVPDAFFGHFTRGYFDGDGSVGLYEYPHRKTSQKIVSYQGSHRFIQGLRDELLSRVRGLNPVGLTSIEEAKTKVIQWQGLDDIERLYCFMYPSEGEYPFLPRKREKFLEILTPLGNGTEGFSLDG